MKKKIAITTILLVLIMVSLVIFTACPGPDSNSFELKGYAMYNGKKLNKLSCHGSISLEYEYDEKKEEGKMIVTSLVLNVETKNNKYTGADATLMKKYSESTLKRSKQGKKIVFSKSMIALKDYTYEEGNAAQDYYNTASSGNTGAAAGGYGIDKLNQLIATEAYAEVIVTLPESFDKTHSLEGATIEVIITNLSSSYYKYTYYEFKN